MFLVHRPHVDCCIVAAWPEGAHNMVGLADGSCRSFLNWHMIPGSLSVLWDESEAKPGHPSEIGNPRYITFNPDEPSLV